MVSKVISLVMPEEKVAQIDSLRGDVPRSTYVRKLIDAGLAKGGSFTLNWQSDSSAMEVNKSND